MGAGRDQVIFIELTVKLFIAVHHDTYDYYYHYYGLASVLVVWLLPSCHYLRQCPKPKWCLMIKGGYPGILHVLKFII